MKRILLVDNDRVLLASLKRALRSRIPGDVEVETHSFAPAALDRARRQRFDVAIGDLVMPVMDGLSFLRRLAVHQPTAARLVLAAPTDLERAKRHTAGDPLVHGWLAKPWDESTLAAEVQAALAESLAARLQAREALMSPDIALPDLIPSLAA